MLDLRGRALLAERFVIQDAAIPFPLRRLYEEMLTSFGMVHAMTRWNERACAGAPDDDALAVSAQRVERSQFFLIVGHDDAGWRLRFKTSSTRVCAAVHAQFLSTVSVDQRKVGSAKNFAPVRKRQRQVDALVALLTQGRTGGIFVPNPMWQPAPEELLEALRSRDGAADADADPLGTERLLTVHPLGGCRMADRSTDGVVNHLGQVFMSGGGISVFKNLVAMDGSIVPTSLGINPLLTIAALAERACAALALEWDCVASATPLQPLPNQPAIAQPMAWAPTPTAVSFTETMSGGLQLSVNKDVDLHGLDDAARQRALDAFARLKVAFTIDDLWRLSRDPRHSLPAQGELTLLWPGQGGAATTPIELGQGLPSAKSFDLSLLALLPSTRNERIWRALEHWFETRGKAFVHGAFDSRLARWLVQTAIRAVLRISDPWWRGALIKVLELWRRSGLFAKTAKSVLAMASTASHHGEARTMSYDLGSLGSEGTPFNGKVRVLAAKRIHYGCSPGYRQRPSKGLADHELPSRVPSNPWRAMIELEVLMVSRTEGRPLVGDDWPLDQRPDWLLAGGWKVVGVGTWALNLNQLVTRHIPQLLGYQSLPDAWIDLASFGAFVTRCLAQTYFWRWRLPAYPEALPQPSPPSPGEKSVGPLPGHVLAADAKSYVEAPGRGETWQWHRLQVGDPKRPAEIVLTNFKPLSTAPPRNHPVLMVHGFVTSGYQFATPRIKTNAVQWLTQKGFDVWVLDLRTSVAVPSSHEAWDFDVVALEDLPTAFKEVMRQTGAGQLHAVVHCMGSAVFNMAVLSNVLTDIATGRSWVRSVVQAQVSMDVVSSPPNRLKASGVRFLEDVLDVDELSVVADNGALTAKRMMETLMDRFLMTWPTNDVEANQQADNELDVPRPTFVATVNRINAMYGRNFSYANLAPGVRDHLHEVFRHANVRTLRHVLQFHRAGRVVDFEGRDTYVSDINIATHYGFPVRFLHSQFGAVFVAASTRRSKIRLDRLHPGVRHERIVLRAPRDAHGKPEHRQWGHFDIWLSERSAQEVFPHVSEFLIEQDGVASIPVPAPVATRAPVPVTSIGPCSAQNPSRPCFSYQLPDLGPWLGWWRPANAAATPDGLARLWFRNPFRDDTGVQAAVFALQLPPFPAVLALTQIGAWAPVVLRLGCGVIDVTVPIKFADQSLVVVCRSTQTTWFEEPDPSIRADIGARLWLFDPDRLELTGTQSFDRS
ncbi:MAG: alpha/beta fold hydrolase, partial [Burkholderiaceae bacterium]